MGPFMLLNSLAISTGLINCLKQVFHDSYIFILSLVFYLASQNRAIHHISAWSEQNYHPFIHSICGRRVSELMDKISTDHIQKFLAIWVKKFISYDVSCYDITSISSYSKTMEYVRRGYNRDHQNLPQVNLAVLFGQKHKLPIYFRRMPGNINDVSTLNTTIKHLDYLGAKKLSIIMDRGIYSMNNVSEMIKKKVNFTMAIPLHRKWVEQIIDKNHESMQIHDNYIQLPDEESLFAKCCHYK
jgi:transposase